MSNFMDKVTTPADIADNGGRLIFLTGSPGSGKTTFIGSIVDIPEFSGHVMILDYGGGMRSLSDRHDIAVMSSNKWSTIEEARVFLSREKHEFKVLVIDLVSEAYQILLREITGEGLATLKTKQTSLEGYGVANTRFTQMIRDFRVLSEQKGIIVIFTSHTLETKDDDSGMILVRANLSPGTLSTTLGIVDIAGYMELKKGKRVLYLVGNERIWAKVQRPQSYGVMPETIENPTFKKLLDVLEPNKEK